MNLNLGDTQAIIEAGRKAGLLRNQLAYVLATAYHETAHKMKPVREMGGEAYLKKKKYYPYVGMGYAQLTWDYNYRKAGKFLDVDFISQPKLLVEPKYAVPILIEGMKDGWFTGKKLSDYITLKKSDFRNARRIVNGMDKADLIAGYAVEYDKQLLAMGYGVDHVIQTPVNDVIPAPKDHEPVSKSKRFWTWISSGGGTVALPFVDWRVQMAIVIWVLLVATYSIYSMPAVKLKIAKLIEAL